MEEKRNKVMKDGGEKGIEEQMNRVIKDSRGLEKQRNIEDQRKRGIEKWRNGKIGEIQRNRGKEE